MADAEIPDSTLRQVVRLEEMVAQTHERAADLYENWLDRDGDAATPGLRARADRHRRLAAATRSVPQLVERSLQGLETRLAVGVVHPGKARELAVLAGLDHLRRLLNRRIEELVAVVRREGASWTEIGAALGVSRQTAHERYRDRTPKTGVREA